MLRYNSFSANSIMFTAGLLFFLSTANLFVTAKEILKANICTMLWYNHYSYITWKKSNNMPVILYWKTWNHNIFCLCAICHWINYPLLQKKSNIQDSGKSTNDLVNNVKLPSWLPSRKHWIWLYALSFCVLIHIISLKKLPTKFFI